MSQQIQNYSNKNKSKDFCVAECTFPFTSDINTLLKTNAKKKFKMVEILKKTHMVSSFLEIQLLQGGNLRLLKNKNCGRIALQDYYPGSDDYSYLSSSDSATPLSKHAVIGCSLTLYQVLSS